MGLPLGMSAGVSMRDKAPVRTAGAFAVTDAWWGGSSHTAAKLTGSLDRHRRVRFLAVCRRRLGTRSGRPPCQGLRARLSTSSMAEMTA